MKPETMRRNAYRLDWERPKVILNKARRTRGKWRLVAFPDSQGVTCYTTYLAVWAKSAKFDELLLAAILNSPVANAFVFTHGAAIDVTLQALKKVPIPHFTEVQAERIRKLVRTYQTIIENGFMNSAQNPARTLMEIDAAVLDGYRIPARLERRLLDFFHGEKRQTPYEFPDYFPEDEDTYFNLSTYMSPEFKNATAEELLRRMSSEINRR